MEADMPDHRLKRVMMPLVLAVSFAGFLQIPPAFGQAYSWTVIKVDSTSFAGSYASLALGSDGFPRIACRAFGDDVEYLSESAGGWTTEYPAFANPKFISLALNSTDEPSVSFFSNDDGTLRFGEKQSGVWSFITVDSDPFGATGFNSSLVLDASGNPRICYHSEGSAYSLRYAARTGGVWFMQNVDVAGLTGYQCAMALDGNGYPRISYYSYTAGSLKFAYRNDSNDLGVWTTEVVDATGPPNTNGFPDRLTSIAIDSQGNPHIAYYDNAHGKLRYASKAGNTWTKTTVDAAGNVGGYVSLQLDATDQPFISYYDVDQQDLKFAHLAQGLWRVLRVDSVGDVGRWSSLRLGPEGDPYIAYSDATTGALKLAHGTTAVVSVVDPQRTAASEVSCWPNPARGRVNVWFSRSLDRSAVVEVLDLAGRRRASIDAGSLEPGKRVLDLGVESLEPGMYFVRLIQGPTTSVTRIAVVH
jgi:hypothetical protein